MVAFYGFHLSKNPRNTFFVGKFTTKINLKVGLNIPFSHGILWLLIRSYPLLGAWPIGVLGPGNPTTAGDDPRWLVGAVPPKKALSGAKKLGWAETAMLCGVLKARNNAIFVFLVACRQEAHLNG